MCYVLCIMYVGLNCNNKLKHISCLFFLIFFPILRVIFGKFYGILKFLFTYFKISLGTLVGKHCCTLRDFVALVKHLK
jgi:hypothetical protein